MAGWPAPKTVYAATHATEMSVAVGMPQPRASVWKSSETAPDPVAMPRNTKYLSHVRRLYAIPRRRDPARAREGPR